MTVFCLFVAMSYGFPTLTHALKPASVPKAITYSADSAQIIRLEYGQTVAVKKLSKIEKTAIKLSQWVN